MNAHTLIAITLAALLVTAGAAAAMPGQSPADPGGDAADDHRPDDAGTDDGADENATETAGNESEIDADEEADDGPPAELIEPVPDHVSQIHELIRSLSGEELGAAISDLVGNGDESRSADRSDAADEQSERRSESADAAGSEDEQADPSGDLPAQAADQVSQIHDAILSWLSGDGSGNPGEAVSGAASG